MVDLCWAARSEGERSSLRLRFDDPPMFLLFDGLGILLLMILGDDW